MFSFIPISEMYVFVGYMMFVEKSFFIFSFILSHTKNQSKNSCIFRATIRIMKKEKDTIALNTDHDFIKELTQHSYRQQCEYHISHFENKIDVSFNKILCFWLARHSIQTHAHTYTRSSFYRLAKVIHTLMHNGGIFAILSRNVYKYMG